MTGLLIDGNWREASGGEWFDSFNPYNGKPWTRIARGSGSDVNDAVAAARRAFPGWASTHPTQRGRLLTRLADMIAKEAEALAVLETSDNGKLHLETLGQARYIPQWYAYFGGLADKIEGTVIPVDKPDMLTWTRPEPYGVVAAITAWNSPLLLAAYKIAPALAAGNTVVLKPSEHASASTVAFARLFERAGFPPGVVNIVTGFGSEIGDSLVSHPDVAKISFTGSEATGRRINQLAANEFKSVTLELGGKSANIVFQDANLDNAANGAVTGFLAASGQTCVAGSRLLVHRSIYDEFLERVITLARDVRLGDPMDPATNMGPVATLAQLDKIRTYIEIAQSEGAECVFAGTESQRPDLAGGWFVDPTIFAGVRSEMRIAQEEVFGPVVAVIPFDDDNEAIAIANNTRYGLAAGIWTESFARALHASQHIRAGTVWINTYRAVSYTTPFGGCKASGIGRENGIEAIRSYLQTKSIWMSAASSFSNPFTIR